jgi:cell division protein ZapA
MEDNTNDILKIKVQIAKRTYPLTIKKSEQKSVQAAVKYIDDYLTKLEKSYDVPDKQDLLAMCCLQLASKIEVFLSRRLQEEKQNQDELSELIDLLEPYSKN